MTLRGWYVLTRDADTYYFCSIGHLRMWSGEELLRQRGR